MPYKFDLLIEILWSTVPKVFDESIKELHSDYKNQISKFNQGVISRMTLLKFKLFVKKKVINVQVL